MGGPPLTDRGLNDGKHIHDRVTTGTNRMPPSGVKRDGSCHTEAGMNSVANPTDATGASRAAGRG
jgi:hypothetical protein